MVLENGRIVWIGRLIGVRRAWRRKRAKVEDMVLGVVVSCRIRKECVDLLFCVQRGCCNLLRVSRSP